MNPLCTLSHRVLHSNKSINPLKPTHFPSQIKATHSHCSSYSASSRFYTTTQETQCGQNIAPILNIPYRNNTMNAMTVNNEKQPSISAYHSHDHRWSQLPNFFHQLSQPPESLNGFINTHSHTNSLECNSNCNSQFLTSSLRLPLSLALAPSPSISSAPLSADLSIDFPTSPSSSLIIPIDCAVQKRRQSMRVRRNRRFGQRQKHAKRQYTFYRLCHNCGAPARPHHMCTHCFTLYDRRKSTGVNLPSNINITTGHNTIV